LNYFNIFVHLHHYMYLAFYTHKICVKCSKNCFWNSMYSILLPDLDWLWNLHVQNVNKFMFFFTILNRQQWLLDHWSW
jgi:hypothetical protein